MFQLQRHETIVSHVPTQHRKNINLSEEDNHDQYNGEKCLRKNIYSKEFNRLNNGAHEQSREKKSKEFSRWNHYPHEQNVKNKKSTL